MQSNYKSIIYSTSCMVWAMNLDLRNINLYFVINIIKYLTFMSEIERSLKTLTIDKALMSLKTKLLKYLWLLTTESFGLKLQITECLLRMLQKSTIYYTMLYYIPLKHSGLV